MQTRIQGTTMPVLEVAWPARRVFREAELSWMTNPSVDHPRRWGEGGLFGGSKLSGGGSIFMTEYRAWQYAGEVAFATKVPGHIMPVQVGQGYEYLVHRHGFMCATPQVTIGVGFQQSLGAGIFGGEGFILQKVGGYGTAWLELSGELIMKDLQPGEMLRVHPGHVGAFMSTVSFQITMVPGIKNMIFGGDGIFLAQLVGPGRIWLQTLPISRLAHQISEYLPHNAGREAPTVAGAGLIGGIVGSILSGNE
jgi:uncharacterized protein (AIM24 family)